MPKKSASARGTVQRARPKTQKNIELVRPIQDEPQTAEEEELPKAGATAITMTAAVSSPASERSATTPASAPARVSAAARIAARNQASQQRQQQRAASLITPEHYAYVRRDLIYTTVLAVIMLAIIITLYFVLGINA